MFFLEKSCLFLFYVYPSLSNSGAAGGKYDKKDTSGVVAGDWLGAGGCPIKIAMVKPKISWYVCISSSYPQLFYLFQSHYIYIHIYIYIYIYILSAYSYHISMSSFFQTILYSCSLWRLRLSSPDWVSSYQTQRSY